MPTTLKEKLNDMIFSQNNNFAVHCPTNENAEVVVKTLYDLGFEWGEGQNLYKPDGSLETKWQNKKKETCYSVNNDSNIIFCARKAFYEKRFRRIVEYDDLIGDVTIGNDKTASKNAETSFAFDNTLNANFNFEQPAAVEAPKNEEIQPISSKLEEPSTVPCQHCGQMIKPTVKFCKYCGQKQDRDFNPKSGELRKQFNNENNTPTTETTFNEDVFIPNKTPCVPVTETVTPMVNPIADNQDSGITLDGNFNFDFNAAPIKEEIKQPEEPKTTVIQENLINNEEIFDEKDKNTDSITLNKDKEAKKTIRMPFIEDEFKNIKSNNDTEKKLQLTCTLEKPVFNVFTITGLKVFEEFHIGTLPMLYRFNGEGLREYKMADDKWMLCDDELLLMTVLTHPEYIHKIEGDDND